MSHAYLKIKVMSLAAEARIIRKEEKKWPGPSGVRTGLRLHRINDVRSEARAALLAYGFIRGRRYAVLENQGTKGVPLRRVATLAARYGVDKKLVEQTIKEWVDGVPAAL